MLRRIFNRIWSLIIHMLMLAKGIEIGKKVRFRGKPFVIRHKQARIVIGESTIINSSNWKYHINMFQRCKLYADRPGSMIKIGKKTRIHGTCIHAAKKITIGDNCLIAANCQIIDSNGHELLFDAPHERINSIDEGRPVVIEDNVWIASGCTILGGTVIGNGSVITAGSIVKGTIPPKSLYGGNPGKLIKTFSEQ